ncbi:hypothetical protein D3C87_1781040 [compost metagenome]
MRNLGRTQAPLQFSPFEPGELPVQYRAQAVSMRNPVADVTPGWIFLKLGTTQYILHESTEDARVAAVEHERAVATLEHARWARVRRGVSSSGRLHTREHVLHRGKAGHE